MKISDEQAKQYGVGPAGKGGEWILDEKNEKYNRATGKWESTGGKTLILWKDGKAVYSKPITDIKTPQATQAAARPKMPSKLPPKPVQRPKIPTTAGDTPNTPDAVPAYPVRISSPSQVKPLPSRSRNALPSPQAVVTPDATRAASTNKIPPGRPMPMTSMKPSVPTTAVKPSPSRPVIPRDTIESVNRPDDVNTIPDQPLPPPRPVIPRDTIDTVSQPDTVATQFDGLPDIPPPEKSEAPVDLTVPAEESTDLKKAKKSKSLKKVIEATQKTVGNFNSPADSLMVTTDALDKAEKPSGGYSIIIDPNRNEAFITSTKGDTLEIFQIGTGDITGTQAGEKYYTPSGEWKVTSEEDKPVGEKEMGPKLLMIDAPKGPKGGLYGLHGPYETKVKKEGGGFVNEGYVSHGCIRFWKDDINKVSKYLDKGSRVVVLAYINGGG